MTSVKENKIVVEVPDGFPAMSLPVEPACRLPDDEIVLSRADESDLDDIVNGLHSSFPEVWWSKHEPQNIRASPALRHSRAVKRYSVWLHFPAFHPIKATLRSTGEFMGFAGWLWADPTLSSAPSSAHAPGPDPIPTSNGVHSDAAGMGVFRIKALEDRPEGAGLGRLMGWTRQDMDEMFAAVDVDSWETEFAGYDRVRAQDMGEVPHWYLAPLFVLDKYRGRGVGSKLLNYAVQRSDRNGQRIPLWLEALPNARPVYLHFGFEPADLGKGPDRAPVMIKNAV